MSISDESIKKISLLVKEGVSIHQEIADLRDGLKDTVKAVSEETGVPVKILNQVIRVMFKDNLDDMIADVNMVEELTSSIKSRK